MSSSGYLELGEGRVFYRRFGAGPRLLVALHGFGYGSGQFAALGPFIGGRYTVYALDLPYHGRTEWEASRFGGSDVEAMVAAVVAREGREEKDVSLLGFSYGGRIILSTLGRFAGRLEAVYLVAPDGLGTAGMSFALLMPHWLRGLWAPVLRRPARLLRLAEALRRRRLIAASSVRFLRFNLESEERRRCLLNTWLSLDDFRIHRRRLGRQLQAADFLVTFVLGRQDDLIPIRSVEKLSAGLKGVRVIVREGSHYSLIDRRLAEILLEKD